MYPILFSFGSMHIYALSVSFVVAWLVFSFFFWRALRRYGITEDKIFDLTFYSTVSACIFARVGFVITHWYLFSGKSPLLLAAVWVAPGLSWFGALIGGVSVLVLFARMFKVRIGLVIDALSISLPSALIFGKMGSLLDGTEIGLPSNLPWAIPYIGHMQLRHPVQVYEILMLCGVLFIVFFLNKLASRHAWHYGLVGSWFFLLYSMFAFVLENVKEIPVYWWQLGANQWILIGIFAESLGVLFVRGGGKQGIKKIGVKIYEKISRRNTDRDKATS